MFSQIEFNLSFYTVTELQQSNMGAVQANVKLFN